MRRVVDNQIGGAAVDELMRSAVEATAETYPHPNPRVGAIVVSPDGTVRSIAAHIGPGTPHAERLALQGLTDTKGDTMVVTLEPCNHLGRTRACTEAIIDAGIQRVYVGIVDPDERVAGSGIEALRQAGIEVIDTGLSLMVEENDPGYFHHRRTGRPLVTLKLATTIDGQIAALDGTSRWITSPEARLDAHSLRAAHDAVLVGAGTVRSDDPELTVRLDDYAGPQPMPIILKGTNEISADARLMRREPIVVEPGSDGVADIGSMLDGLGDKNITSVLVEGGAHVARSFLDAEAVDELVVYVGAKVAAGVGLPAIAGPFASIDDARPVEIAAVERVGPDIKITSSIGRNR